MAVLAQVNELRSLAAILVRSAVTCCQISIASLLPLRPECPLHTMSGHKDPAVQHLCVRFLPWEKILQVWA